ncbi:MAG: 1,4-dihydroxy-2-naphthoate polyprenyltransferase [Ignavibacteriaceae bacterium]
MYFSSEKINNWILASRPKTLLAAFVPVLVGSSLAFAEGRFYPLVALVALFCSVLIQVGTNFANDLYDHLRGADTKKRKGPKRVLAEGWISVSEMNKGILIVFLISFIAGLYLVFWGGWIILVIGVVSIIAGLAYTAGPFPLAYNGLGDLFVFTFFGVIGTMGTYFLHSGEFTFISFLISVPVGSLITNILVVNNYRDIEEDRLAGKNTLAVKFGRDFSRYQFLVLMILSFLTPLILFFFFDFNYTIFLPVLGLPIAVKLINMLKIYEGTELNLALEQTAKFSAIYGILFSAGIIL